MTTETAREAVLTHTPVFFPPADGSYFGIITKPAEGSAKTGVVVLSGTQFGTTTVGKNRMFVRMAARLAAAGYGSIRFDYLGVGEASEGAVDYRLEEPATPAMHAAVDAMRAAGFDNIIVTGTCFGSRTALVGTAEDPDVSGLFLIVPPVRDMIKGEGGSTHLAIHRSSWSLLTEAMRPSTIRRHGLRKVITVGRTVIRSKWRLLQRRLGRQGAGAAGAGDAGPSPELAGVSTRFLQPLRQLVDRETPVRMMWGTDDFLYKEFLEGTEGRLGELLERAGDRIDQVVMDGKVRGFGTVTIQDRVLEETVAWAKRFPAMTVATRVDPETATTEEVAYFGDAPRMYGAVHLPATEPATGLVVCPSVYGELINIYRLEVIQSRQLAAAGIAVQRFHYRGDGNSEGGIELLGLDAMVGDAVEAAQALIARTGVERVGFLGAGLGAFVAAAAAETIPGAPLVLWHPQFHGSTFFRSAQMVDQVDEDGYVEVLGFTLHRNLLQSLVGRELVDMLQTPRPVLIVQIAAGDQPADTITGVAEAWRGKGADVTVAAVGGSQKWWDAGENWQSHETRGRTQRTLDATSSWLAEHL